MTIDEYAGLGLFQIPVIGVRFEEIFPATLDADDQIFIKKNSDIYQLRIDKLGVSGNAISFVDDTSYREILSESSFIGGHGNQFKDDTLRQATSCAGQIIVVRSEKYAPGILGFDGVRGKIIAPNWETLRFQNCISLSQPGDTIYLLNEEDEVIYVLVTECHLVNQLPWATSFYKIYDDDGIIKVGKCNILTDQSFDLGQKIRLYGRENIALDITPATMIYIDAFLPTTTKISF